MNIRRIRRTRFKTIVTGLDPVTAYVMKDRLGREEIERLAEWADQPELADPIMAFLPERNWKLSQEERFLRRMHARLREQEVLQQIREMTYRGGGQTTLAPLVA